MSDVPNWRDELRVIDTLMRDLSRMTEPQEAALMYGKRLREARLIPSDTYMSISRRELQTPHYRITRDSRWADAPNPWKQRDRLPLHTGGLLSQLLYENAPNVIDNLPARLDPSDPAFEFLRGFELMATLPQYDGGEALNMGVLLIRKASDFPVERYPVILWQSNLWGRAVSNLVLRQELQASFTQLKQTHKSLEREMASVGAVQRSLLPGKKTLAGLEVAVHYQTSQRAGGDYYDFLGCDDGCHGMLIADVSGHGAAAAVLMAVTHALAQLHPGAGVPPGELLGFLNRHLTERYTRNGSFVTAFYGLFNPADRTYIHASAGHPPPRILRGGAVLSLDGPASLPLGIDADEIYSESCTALQPGDQLVLYTDGITEARNPDNDLFGTDRLDAALLGRRGDAAHTLNAVLRSVEAFAGTRAPDDDRTMVVARI